jgi:hypothetical protein
VVEGSAGPDDATDAIPDHAIVVRGGVMTETNLRSSLERSMREDGVYDISVWVSADLDADGIAQWVRERDPGCEQLPHNRLQESTVGAIRACGADVLLTEPPPGHHSVRFSTRPTDGNLQALVAAFDPPRRNPAARGA